jgi:hypothetical protein
MWKINSPQMNFASAHECFGLLGCLPNHSGEWGRGWVGIIAVVDVVVGASEKRLCLVAKS